MDKKPRIDSSLVEAFVSNAHTDLDRVKELLSQEPNLVNASWDWGDGDWETGLGAAAHMGRQDIAEFLLANGARLDIFAAAMLGNLAVVKTILASYPQMKKAAGPHGIPLFAHAKAGGVREMIDYLENIG